MFEAEKVYHIYNRANGRENLFIEERNFHFFLDKYFHHISPIAKTFAFCLMPNHFHIMIRIKAEEEV
jgi:REP element-mobilizing transposase RayT